MRLAFALRLTRRSQPPYPWPPEQAPPGVSKPCRTTYRARRSVAMTRKQYAVHTVRDEPVRLRDQLDHIAADGGRVVSVIWQPARQVSLEPGLPPHEVASGYVVVSEHELPEAAGQ